MLRVRVRVRVKRARVRVRVSFNCRLPGVEIIPLSHKVRICVP